MSDPGTVRVHRLAQAVQVADLLVERVDQLLEELDRFYETTAPVRRGVLHPGRTWVDDEADRLDMVRSNLARQVAAYRSVRE